MQRISKTKRFPVTHIYQNHIDTFSDVIKDFCNNQTEFECEVVSGKKSMKLMNVPPTFCPEKLTYKVTGGNEASRLTVKIDNGVVVNIRNGNEALYGLYHLIIDSLDQIKAPALFAFLRRHWLVNLSISLWIVPALLMRVFFGDFSFLAWFWLVIIAVLIISLIVSFYEDNFSYKNELALNTKIVYGEYRDNLSIPINALLSSVKTTVSLLASIATILSFLLFLFKR